MHQGENIFSSCFTPCFKVFWEGRAMHSADTPLLPTMGMDHLLILMIPGAAQGFLPTSLPTPPSSSCINHNNCWLITPLGFWPCSCSSPVPGLGSKRKPKEKAMECPKSRAGLERMREGWILTAPPCRAQSSQCLCCPGWVGRTASALPCTHQDVPNTGSIPRDD